MFGVCVTNNKLLTLIEESTLKYTQKHTDTCTYTFNCGSIITSFSHKYLLRRVRNWFPPTGMTIVLIHITCLSESLLLNSTLLHDSWVFRGNYLSSKCFNMVDNIEVCIASKYYSPCVRKQKKNCLTYDLYMPGPYGLYMPGNPTQHATKTNWSRKRGSIETLCRLIPSFKGAKSQTSHNRKLMKSIQTLGNQILETNSELSDWLTYKNTHGLKKMGQYSISENKNNFAWSLYTM